MRRIWLILTLASVILLCGCNQQEKLKRQMLPLAKQYLHEVDSVADFQDVTVKCVDTITELAYAKLTSGLLAEMEMQYEEALQLENSGEALTLAYNEIVRTKDDIDNLIEDGELSSPDVLLYWVTASCKKNGSTEEFMFFVNPDKKSLHNLDPFGNNLLYQE